MKLLLLFLLGTAAFAYKGQPRAFSRIQPEPQRRRLKGTSIGGKRSLADYARQQRDRCELLADDTKVNRQISNGQAIIGACPDKPKHTIVLIPKTRSDDTWVYTTMDPRKSYDDIIDFLRAQSVPIDDTHPIKMEYSYKTRDGHTRNLQVRNDMDLWAAFLLQAKFPAVEVLVSIATIAPSAQPTTAVPSHLPTTGHPTIEMNSRILNAQNKAWLDSKLTKLNLYIGDEPLYRMTEHGRASSVFRARAAYNGPWIAVFKTKNDHIFGAYNDIQWTNNGGTYFYCDECFMWSIKDRKYSEWVSYVFQNHNYATYHHTSYGPCFGRSSFDLCMDSPTQSGDSAKGYTYMSNTYKVPGTENPFYLDSASTSTFYAPDWEVFPVYSKIGMNSRIITKKEDIDWLNSLLPTGKKIGNVCYRFGGGFGKTSTSVSYFRNGCAGKGAFVFTALSKNGNVFGAYSGADWSTSTKNYVESSTAFLYIMKNRDFERMKLDLRKNKEKEALYQHTSYGPIFGKGYDLGIDSPSTPKGYGKVGYTYDSPNEDNVYYLDSETTSAITFQDWEVHLIETA